VNDFLLQEKGFIMSQLMDFKPTEGQKEEMVSDKDTETMNEVEEMSNAQSFLDYVDSIILCPDNNFQCRDGKKKN
jgi:hypothetical protein